MRAAGRIGAVAAALVATAVLAPGTAAAAPRAATGTVVALHDEVAGIEYSAGATVAKFAGTATGTLPGLFGAVIDHDVPDTRVVGGTVSVRGARGTVSGTVGPSPITPVRTVAGCNDETFAVAGAVTTATGGTGTYAATLTHYRAQIGTTCLTYAARIAGTLDVG